MTYDNEEDIRKAYQSGRISRDAAVQHLMQLGHNIRKAVDIVNSWDKM